MTAASPFRYPGAKGRMAKSLLPLILPHVEKSGSYCEPFVGGGSMALAVAKAAPRARLTINDADPDVAAVWMILATKDDAWFWMFRSFVRATVPTIEMHAEWKAARPEAQMKRAFRALFLNRTSFSGIIGAGPIGGKRQRSRWAVGCRWNVHRLCDQLDQARALLRGRTMVTCDDFRAVLARNTAPCYLDPPYWEKGKMCYPTSMVPADHEQLAALLRGARYPWVLSYDAHPKIAELYGFADVRTVDASYSMSGAGRQGWVGARELVIVR